MINLKNMLPARYSTRGVLTITPIVTAIVFFLLFIVTTWRIQSPARYPNISPPGHIHNVSSMVSSLRVMPMGASTIFGEKNKGDYGFRKELRDQLNATGAAVNMVGTARMGDMLDNDCEAHMGFNIDHIHEMAKRSVPALQPNVVVLLAGANDVYQLRDVEHAGQRLEALINFMLEASPRVTIVMATLLLSLLPDCQPYDTLVNNQYRQLYQKLASEGKPVVLAELHPDAGLPGRPEAVDIGPDGSHPTDLGYVKMAYIFADAIREASRKGFLQEPIKNGVPADGDAEGEPRVGLPADPPPGRRDLVFEEPGYSRLQKRGWCQIPEDPRDRKGET